MEAMMAALTLKALSKSFEGQQVIKNLSFEVNSGEIIALLGPSGCGKSTTLALIAGLVEPDQGEILWRGQSLRGIPSHQRNFGLMFQDLALFPHLDVFENVAFGLRVRKVPFPVLQQRVKEVMELVNLQGFERRDVNSLSGGEMQRVALARALAPEPQLLMLDEPLASLDRTLKDRLAVELRQILRQTHQTALYVTHDQEEAFTVADRVILMNKGRIEQIGTPQEIYHRPASPFVAQFLGMKNFIAGEIIHERGKSWLLMPFGRIPYPDHEVGKGIVLIRPEGARVDGEGVLKIEGRVVQKFFRGDHCEVDLQWDEGRFSFTIPCSEKVPVDGNPLTLLIPADAVVFFRS
ncbi:MAG: ABC transporter ATP-binding protein [Anaerolineales bacterium]